MRAYPSPRAADPALAPRRPQGLGQFAPISWEEALDITAKAFREAEEAHGPEGGLAVITMPARWASSCATASTGCAMSGNIPASTTRFAPPWPGPASSPEPAFLAGPDPREMAKSDVVVIWGTNAVHTQVNVMTHAMRARKEPGRRSSFIDIYDNATMKQADLKLVTSSPAPMRPWPAQ